MDTPNEECLLVRQNREGAKNSGGKRQAYYQSSDYRCTASHFLCWLL